MSNISDTIQDHDLVETVVGDICDRFSESRYRSISVQPGYILDSGTVKQSRNSSYGAVTIDLPFGQQTEPGRFNYRLPAQKSMLESATITALKSLGVKMGDTPITKTVVVIHKPTAEKPYYRDEYKTVTEYV